MLKQVQIKQLTKVQMEYRYYHCECLLKFGALTICTENPIIAGRIQMERFILVECWEKKVILWLSEVLPFSRFENRNDRNFLRKPKIYRYFVNGHNTIPFLISVRKKYQYHLTEDFFIEISATKVSALGLKEYARHRQVVLLTECSLRLLAKRTLQRQCQGRQQIQILTHR